MLPDLKADETTALLAAIVESSEDAIVSKTLDGTIRSWNRAAERMFGYTAAEAVGRHITLIIPKERHPEETQILARIVKGERIDHFETVRQAKDGRRLDISITVSPIRDGTGRVVGASKVARDITERKMFEQERERLLKIERATRERLAEAVAARDEFIAVAAHELRNPLNVFHLTLQLLHRICTDANSTTQVRELIERSRQHLNRLSTLVDRLLDVTRISAGTFELLRESFDLSGLLREVVGRFANEPFTSPISLELDPSITGTWDRLRVDQALTNLISNGIKYGKNKPVIVTAVRREDQAIVTVRDHGQGIEPSDFDKIFERFGRSGQASGKEGLGLGLWITKRIIEAHGGSIFVESEPGHGAAFTITLPC